MLWNSLCAVEEGVIFSYYRALAAVHFRGQQKGICSPEFCLAGCVHKMMLSSHWWMLHLQPDIIWVKIASRQYYSIYEIHSIILMHYFLDSYNYVNCRNKHAQNLVPANYKTFVLTPTPLSKLVKPQTTSSSLLNKPFDYLLVARFDRKKNPKKIYNNDMIEWTLSRFNQNLTQVIQKVCR